MTDFAVHEEQIAADRTVPRAEETPARGYGSLQEYLLDELSWLNRMLAAEVLRARRADFFDHPKDFRGFFIADEEIDALLAAGVFTSGGSGNEEGADSLDRQAAELLQVINERISATAQTGIFLPGEHLRRAFDLSEWEKRVLVILLAPCVDARYTKLFAYIQNDITKRLPGVDLLLRLLCRTPEERLRSLPLLHRSAPLLSNRFIEEIDTDPGSSSTQRFLLLNRRIAEYLCGGTGVDRRLEGVVEILAPLEWNDVVLPPDVMGSVRRIAQDLLQQVRSGRPCMMLHGPDGVGKKTIARAVCGDAGVSLAVLDLRRLVSRHEDAKDLIQTLLREGLLQPMAVFFEHCEVLNGKEVDEVSASLVRYAASLGWLTFFGSTGAIPAPILPLPLVSVEVGAPDGTLQQLLWQREIGESLDAGDPGEPEDLVSRFSLTGGQIHNAVCRARTAAATRGQNHIRIDDLVHATNEQSQPDLSSLARRIEARFTWEDLVLPEDQIRQLRELVSQVRHRRQVFEEWGFNGKVALGRGLNALFGGPSGTGKTMAAEVIAHDLGLDLYKIDLSAVISKYIGETEKNLNRVFTEAAHSNAILFFDEADALFGKRSEVRDSHDRYANIETAYLLQKMEEYDGITILATNFRQNLDDAFTRRMRFIVEFPFPDEQHRLRIWQQIWPAHAPLGPDVDPGVLAHQYRLSGGNIRNVALAAAFLASSNGQVISMKHVSSALRREFQKMGKVLAPAENTGARS